MQTDMHYFGAYVMARCAGIETDTARSIATAAEYVDDSDRVTRALADGTILVSEPTAHHPLDARNLSPIDQRRTWVPFHFIPGNEGGSQDLRRVCRMDSAIAKAMVTRNLSLAREDFGIPLVGITAHVYADTFAHYGFSGVSSSVNHILVDSIEYDVPEREIDHLREHHESFLERNVKGPAADMLSALGHAGGATFPDRPYLKWRFKYADGRDSGWRDNPTTFLLACRKLYEMFTEFNHVTQGDYADDASRVEFSSIEHAVHDILNTIGEAGGRAMAWNAAVIAGRLYPNPKAVQPPNYVGFRYGGKLQSVHHIDAFEVVENLSQCNPSWSVSDKDHFVYSLGPPMRPAGVVRTGKLYGPGHSWCAIDTLLSGAYPTVSDAIRETKRRLKENE